MVYTMDLKKKCFEEINQSIRVDKYCISTAAAAAQSLQSCPTRCNPIDGSPPGSPVPGILQARTLEWVAISFSSAWKWKVKVKSRSRVRLFATPWTAAYRAPPSMGFSRQEYWSRCHCLLQSLMRITKLPISSNYFEGVNGLMRDVKHMYKF